MTATGPGLTYGIYVANRIGPTAGPPDAPDAIDALVRDLQGLPAHPYAHTTRRAASPAPVSDAASDAGDDPADHHVGPRPSRCEQHEHRGEERGGPPGHRAAGRLQKPCHPRAARNVTRLPRPTVNPRRGTCQGANGSK